VLFEAEAQIKYEKKYLGHATFCLKDEGRKWLQKPELGRLTSRYIRRGAILGEKKDGGEK
jgi:hypothetical protein